MLTGSHRTLEPVINILFVGLNAGPEPTGIGPYTSGLAHSLSAQGNHVELITTFPHYPEWRFTDGVPPRTRITVEHGVTVRRVRHRLPTRGSSISRVLSEVTFGFRALFSRWGRPDAVVLVSPALFSSALLVPRLMLQGIPFVLWVQDLYGLGIRETGDGRLSFLAGLVGRLEAWTLRHAQSVVVIGERMAMEVNDAGVENDRITVVRNWTHIDPVALADVSAVRARFGWHADETVVLHTGNMGVKQDLKNVVEAARLADNARRPVRFVLVGDGSDRPAVEEAALGVQHLQLLPPQTEGDFQSMMQAADVLLVNEHPEVRGMALPSKLTSYFAAARPVLAASHEFSATSAELRASGAGDRVDAGDPAALLEGVERLAADPVRMEALANAGTKYRWALLREETAVRSFERVLKRITATRHHRRAEVVISAALPSTGEITLRRG